MEEAGPQPGLVIVGSRQHNVARALFCVGVLGLVPYVKGLGLR